MTKDLKLFMVMVGCKPMGRFTEQHDIFFGIGKSLSDLLPQLIDFWPEAKGQIHIDAWREVNYVNGFNIQITKRAHRTEQPQLFFINLGGYKENEFEEYHYKTLVVSKTKAEAIKVSKQTAFYKHCGFKGATSHIDDQYGVDVDDIYKIDEILPQSTKDAYQLNYIPSTNAVEDQLHIGYLKLSNLKKE